MLVLSVPLKAQVNMADVELNSERTYRVELMDGTVFVGKYLEHSTTVLVLKTTSLPRVEIPINSIKRIDLIAEKNIRNGQYWFPNPNYTRYFFSPTAIPLDKGSAYYQNAYIFINSINVGVTMNLTLGGGFEFLSTFSGDPIVFLTPKFGVEASENVYLGGGVLFVSSLGDGNLGILYGMSTFGDRDKNFSAGLGWGFVEGEYSSRPTITLSGISRTSRRLSLVTENWFFPLPDDDYYGLFSYGFRFFGEKNAVDLGFINNAEIASELVIGVPYVDFVINF